MSNESPVYDAPPDEGAYKNEKTSAQTQRERPGTHDNKKLPPPPQGQDRGKQANKPQEEPVYEIDMNDRDPCNLNAHLQVQYDAIIGEPDDSHSAEVIWGTAFKAYNIGQSCCYTCLTYVCAIPLAFLWGCNFATITFCHIWSVTPCFRVFQINCDCVSRFFQTCVHCYCDPCYESMALMWTKIYVHIRSNANAFEDRTYGVIKRESRGLHKGRASQRGSLHHRYGSDDEIYEPV